MKLFKIKPFVILLVILAGVVFSFMSGVFYTRYAAGPSDYFDSGIKLPEVKCTSIEECNLKGFEADHIIAGFPVSYYWSDYSSQRYYDKELILVKQQNKQYNPSKILLDKLIINILVWMGLSYVIFILFRQLKTKQIKKN